MEVWKDVRENANYEVSNTGRVRRKGSDVDKASRERKGYLAVNLYKDGKESCRTIHRLVAEAFIPNPECKPDVNHIDGVKHNNFVENLEWATKSENMLHAYQTGLAKPSRSMLGKKNPNAGRKGKPIRIVETGEVFNTSLECEKAINGNNRHINDCLKGRLKTHRGYHFEYI